MIRGPIAENKRLLPRADSSHATMAAEIVRLKARLAEVVGLLEKIIPLCKEETWCPCCGNDTRKQYDCKHCGIDHLGKECLRQGCHADDCELIKAEMFLISKEFKSE